MNPAIAPYPDWKAPADDGQSLIWPEPQRLLSQTRENHKRLGAVNTVRIQDVPLRELRERLRQWLGHKEPSQPLIATGHQIELAHPGVWVKDVLTNRLASKLGGAAYHFAVDTDAPKHLMLRWPGGGRPLSDDPAATTADWAALVGAPTPQHLSSLTEEFARAAAGWNFVPSVGSFLASMRRLALESDNLTWVLTNSMHQLDWDLGLRHHSLLVSPIWMSSGYLLFAHHVLAHAGQFATDYNAVLASYRREHGIRSPGRPWPDLHRSGEECEAPFWLDRLDRSQRLRATMTCCDGGWAIKDPASDERFCFDATAGGWDAAERFGKFLTAHSLRLSPRALTLTAFLRLCVADQFVHGIGGGRYDQVTDRMIAQFFTIEPPKFSVTTATLLFPAAIGKRPVDLTPMIVEGRRLRHAWGSRDKRQMARLIETLPRRSDERGRLFGQMHQALVEWLREPSYKEAEQRLDDARRRRETDRDLFDRELFYAIQPAERLQSLIERYDNQIA